jgi:hypothetical protein
VGVKSYVQRKALDRVPAPVLEAGGRAVVKAVDTAVERRWDKARQRAAEAKGETLDERLRSVTKSISRELTSLGAATGAAAAAPGFGTAGALSMLTAELGWFGFRATDHIMTVGALYGRVDSTAEERRAWVLSVLAFGEQAADEFAVLVGQIDHEVAERSGKVGALFAGIVQGDVATIDTLRRINTSLAARVVARYGSRRGVATLARLLPFGVGAAVGGVGNWALSRALTTQARRFFDGYHLLVVPPPPRRGAPPLPSPSAALGSPSEIVE